MSPLDLEMSKMQLLMPHRLSVEYMDVPFQRQRAVSAVSVLTNAMEGKHLCNWVTKDAGRRIAWRKEGTGRDMCSRLT